MKWVNIYKTCAIPYETKILVCDAVNQEWAVGKYDGENFDVYFNNFPPSQDFCVTHYILPKLPDTEEYLESIKNFKNDNIL